MGYGRLIPLRSIRAAHHSGKYGPTEGIGAVLKKRGADFFPRVFYKACIELGNSLHPHVLALGAIHLVIL